MYYMHTDTAGFDLYMNFLNHMLFAGCLMNDTVTFFKGIFFFKLKPTQRLNVHIFNYAADN